MTIMILVIAQVLLYPLLIRLVAEVEAKAVVARAVQEVAADFLAV